MDNVHLDQGFVRVENASPEKLNDVCREVNKQGWNVVNWIKLNNGVIALFLNQRPQPE